MLVSPCSSRLDLLHPVLLLHNPKGKQLKNSIYLVHNCQWRPTLQATVPSQHCTLQKQHMRMSQRCHGTSRVGSFSTISLKPEVDDIVGRALNMNFFERLHWAWNILFPRRPRKASNAEIAKKRLKMILFSDRCEISDEAKQKIVNNIVCALSDFVEIESEEKVQLDVSADPALGTVYSVSIPVRRVKPDYQEHTEGYGDQGNSQYTGLVGRHRFLGGNTDLSSLQNETP